jgi:peptidoglycan lytic transglycosylase G
MRRWLITGALLVALLIAGLAGVVAFNVLRQFDSPGPLAAESTVVIPRGAGLSAIAETLTAAGAIRDALTFRLGVTFHDAARELEAGEYRIPASASMREVMDILRSGATVVHRLTVPEGLTSGEIVDLVAAAEGLSGDPGPVPPEGSLLPETYHYSWDDGRAQLIGRMQTAQQEVLRELWAERDPDLPFSSPEEAVILASIVEEETALDSERALVASVFINRLKRGMRLQSDPTVAYGLTQGKAPLGRALTRQDLAVPNPYNTYLNVGLPPGPIANAGRAALKAVLNPAATGYLYFVADGSGGHAFAETLDEHNRNVAKWRKLQRQKSQSAD